MFEWLNGPGAALKYHIPGSTNYLTDLKLRSSGDDTETSRSPKPFPLNPHFVSEKILSEDLRNEIYERVAVRKKTVREVSVEMGVDMRRVAAVVRLVEMEKRWRNEGKPLALPYARAVHEMVPTTPLVKGNRPQIAHESINDLPVHRLTDPQIFHPVSESRQFTRIDAGRVFSAAPALEHTESSTEDLIDPVKAANRIKRDPRSIERVGKGDEEMQVLQPADVRIPHPQLVMYERDRITYPNEQRLREKRYETLLKSQEEADQEAKRLAKEREEKRTTRIQPESSRFEFRITDVTVSQQTTGADGRGPRGVGRRYGVPNYDRKKGQVKIPTKVEV